MIESKKINKVLEGVSIKYMYHVLNMKSTKETCIKINLHDKLI